MRKFITRTISATTIQSTNVEFEKGTPVMVDNPPLVVSGTVKDSEVALKMVRKEFGLTANIKEITFNEATYEISVEDFLKYATKVEPEKTE